MILGGFIASQGGGSGGGGTASAVVFPFTSETNITIPHTLGRIPIVQVVDDLDNEMVATSIQVTDTQIVIDFGGETVSGKVIYI